VWRTFQVGVNRRSVRLFWLFCLFAIYVSADDQGRFAISQASFNQGVITAYLDIRDQNGQPGSNLVLADLSATLEGHPLQLKRLTPFAQSGEGVAYLFLIDVSKSIGSAQFQQNQRFTSAWIDGLGQADRMDIATFGVDDRPVVDFTADKAVLKKGLAALRLADEQTRLYDALQNAMSLRTRSEPGFPARRAVVVLSDGLDEGSQVDEDNLLKLLGQSHIPVYAIASSHLREPYRQQGLEALNQIATASGGDYIEAGAGPLVNASNRLADAIRSALVVQMACAGCQPSIQTYSLQISLKTGSPKSAKFGLALMAQPLPPKPWWKQTWVILGLLVLIVAIVAFVVVKSRRPETKMRDAAGAGEPAKPDRKGEALQADGLPLRFTTVAGKQPGREYDVSLRERVVVGRDESCDLSLPEDAEVSGRHCQLTRAGRVVELSDLQSRNGTLLNGARVVARQRLESGDLIRVGRTELRVSFGEPN
jgi:hypothetical protein